MSNAEPALVFTLSEPVTFGSETINELRLRAPRGRDVRRFKQDPTTGDFLSIAAELAGYPDAVVDKMTARDALDLVAQLAPFFAPAEEPAESGG